VKNTKDNKNIQKQKTTK